MINYVQNNTSLGAQNYLQQQAVVNRVPEDIRTNNAEQVSLRNVEQAVNTDRTRPVESETAAEKARNQEGAKETKDSQEEDQQQPLIPPPPTRFQLQVKESAEKVNKTQQAVTQFFLTAATISTRQSRQEQEAAANSGQRNAAMRSSVDVVA